MLVLRRALNYVNLLDENENLASSVRILGMAQTLAQITDTMRKKNKLKSDSGVPKKK